MFEELEERLLVDELKSALSNMDLYEKEMQRRIQSIVLQAVHVMGVRSLDPEIFCSFENALNQITNNRDISLCLDVSNLKEEQSNEE